MNASQQTVPSVDGILTDSAPQTAPASPTETSRVWEADVQSSVYCEETAAGKHITIVLNGDGHTTGPSITVSDWTLGIRAALTERRIKPFQQVHKPWDQQELAYIREKLERYAFDMRDQGRTFDRHDCVQILEHAKELFSYVLFLENAIMSETAKNRTK